MSRSQSRRQRHPSNTPGDFYTDGGCTACGVPEAEAPDLLAELDEGNDLTYFVRQPTTADEIERACRAIEVCCTDSLRYGGKDRAIIDRLRHSPHCCDYLPSGEPRPYVPPFAATGGWSWLQRLLGR